MAPPNIAERLAQEVDVIDAKMQAALSQIGREEKAAAADEVSPIVRHRASIARLKVMGFTSFNPSYALEDLSILRRDQAIRAGSRGERER
jgi:hypothetical protein